VAKQHFKKTAGNRQGYFMKGKPNPTPGYKSLWDNNPSKKGFKGARTQVHHAVPQVSIDDATSQIKDRPKLNYIKNVKWVTPWNINNDSNLIGLPTIWSYMIAAENVKRLSQTENGIAKLNALARTFNNLSNDVRSEAFRLWESGYSPGGYPIHNPTSWGHTEYNKLVATDVKTEVWEPLNEQSKKHQENPEQVDAQMRKLSKRWMGRLQNKSGATVRKWLIKNRTGEAKWYKPFLMADVKKSPLG
jgi:hypothetical protein